MSVLVVLEERGGKWNRVSFEALTAAQKLAENLGTDVCGVVLGSGTEELTADATHFDFARVYRLEAAALAQYTPDGFTTALHNLIQSAHPAALVFPHTYQVRDYAPKLAARLGRPLVSDVVEIKAEENRPVFVRQVFQGKLNADVALTGEPLLISVQAGAFRAAEPGPAADAPVERLDLAIDQAEIRSQPEPPFREEQRSVDLSAAELIVSVGRGIKEKENLQLVQDLAAALGAEVAASRPICDNGWLPMERQVGSSGQTVAPKVYFAIGISGAIQHLVGMKGARTVVAINKDESAPIFETADYGIVGDLFEIVPALTEAVKKAKA